MVTGSRVVKQKRGNRKKPGTLAEHSRKRLKETFWGKRAWARRLRHYYYLYAQRRKETVGIRQGKKKKAEKSAGKRGWKVIRKG